MQVHTATRSDALPAPSLRTVVPFATVRSGNAADLSLAQALRRMGVTKPYRRNREIFGEAEPAEFLFKVIEGCVRTYRILSDGRRQIGSFYLPGEVFGLECGDQHTLSADAIVCTTLLLVKRRALNELAGRDAAVRRELFALTGRELRRSQDRILLLIKSARERVAGFLLEMAERLSTVDAVALPMSRQDIADYLGLTIETVSRTLTALESSAAIAIPTSRHIILRDRAALGLMVG